MSRGIDWTPEQSKLVTDLLYRHLPGVKAWAYGSRARWNARPDSDLDLVVFAERSQKAQVSALREALEESSLPYKVDLFVWDEVPANFRPLIEKERVEVSPLAAASSPGAAGASATPLSGAAPRNAPKGWRLTQLGEIARNVSRAFDFSNKSRVLFVNTGDVFRGRFLVEEYSPVASLPGQAKKAIEPGDILYSEIRPGNGRCLLVSRDCSEYVVSTKFMVISCDKTVANSGYVYLWITSPDCEAEFKVVADSRSGTFPQITFDSVAHAPILLPPIGEQSAIQRIIGALDDKIELNRRINQTLEEMAQALFKSWFVDFDPVKAKSSVLDAGGTPEEAEQAAMQAISGKSPQELTTFQRDQPEAYADLARTASLFPSCLIESELGQIPEGWEIVALSELCTLITKGTTPTKSDLANDSGESNVPFIKVKDLTESGEIKSSDLEMISSRINEGPLKRSILACDDLLFSIAGTIGRVAIVPNDLAGSNVNQALGVIRLVDKFRHLFVVVSSLRSDRVRQEIASKVVQGVQSNTSLANLREIKILLASPAELDVWNRTAGEWLREVRRRQNETEHLSILRDSLLPKLLSGELQIPDELLQTEPV